jgi:hypothetical protein
MTTIGHHTLLYFAVLGMILILLTLVKIELCGELLVVLALSRFSCIAGFFLASRLPSLSISVSIK